MRLEDICHEAGVTLAYFDNDLWPRPGMILSDMKIIFVNISKTVSIITLYVFKRCKIAHIAKISFSSFFINLKKSYSKSYSLPA